MKLSRIVVEEFRKFRQPLALDGLQPGLNLFVGPNEAGKSTVAAAIRAAFLERYSTKTVADLAPRGESGARPSVELAFSHAGRDYVLKKQFLTKARCELLIDGGAERLDGEAAENALAALLGFDLPGRGQSKPEQAGIPGLLWIQQGEGQSLSAPAGHAQGHLREALTRLSGELAAGDGDRLFERVSAERGALLDARNGKPKGVFKDADEALARARSARDDALRAKAQLDADVDRLAALRQEHGQAQQAEPWKALEARAAEARTRLAALARERETLEGLRRELAQAASNLGLLQDQVGRDQQDEAELRTLEQQAQAAAERLRQSEAPLARALQQRDAQRAAADAARLALTAAQAQADRRDLEQQLRQLDADTERLDGALKAADELIAQGSALKAEVVGIEVLDADLQGLRGIESQRASLRAQLQAVATRLSYRLEPGARALLDGRELEVDGQLLLTAAAELELPGVGRLRIEPGGKDLPALQRELAALDAEGAALLARLGAASVDEVEARHARHAALKGDLEGMRRALQIHAPKGIDMLRGQRDEALARRDALRARLHALPPAAAGEALDLASARQALGEAEAAAEHAGNAWAEARRAADAEATRAQMLQSQATASRTALLSPERVAQRQERAGRLAETRSHHDLLARRLGEAEAALDGQRPALIEQDALRFEQSAALEREAQQRRHGEMLQLQGKLDQAGAQGLGERLSEAEADCERLQRRRDELDRRAQALDLLLRLLSDKRAAATQRLQAPLARRLRHYLGLLFPEAALRLDDALLPAALQRAGGEDALDSLSFGTREQLGILARFAYADLLQEAGRPTLLVLDDALVHADEGRRDFMKRALFDAATRHQILMFTCHGEAWRDLGVAQRRIGDA